MAVTKEIMQYLHVYAFTERCLLLTVSGYMVAFAIPTLHYISSHGGFLDCPAVTAAWFYRTRLLRSHSRLITLLISGRNFTPLGAVFTRFHHFHNAYL